MGWIGIKAVDTEHIVVFGGDDGHYTVTANGGRQWVIGGPLSTRDLNDLTMLDQHDYWAACDFDSIIRTKDSGISWEDQPYAGIYEGWDGEIEAKIAEIIELSGYGG